MISNRCPASKSFDRVFQLDIGNTVRENRVQSLLGQFRAFACVTKIVRDQIETLRLCGAVAGKVNDHVSSGSARFRRIESVRFQTRWSGGARSVD